MKRQNTSLFLAIVGMTFCANQSFAQIKLSLPDIWSDHAVLQKNTDVTIWGKGPSSKQIAIVTTWNPKDTVKTHVGDDGFWTTKIHTSDSQTPQELKIITEHETKTISDIIFGDVWLCSGQSNMEFNIRWGVDKIDKHYQPETNNKLRFFQVEHNYEKYPAGNAKGQWKICDSTTAKDFSIVGYTFGQKLSQKTNTPIGLIGSYWGGTNIQDWIPAENLTKDDFSPSKTKIDPWEGCPKGFSVVYNAMIYPIEQYSIKGAVWYQGESNVDYDAQRYGALLDTMIHSWREKFQTNLPFYAIQIAPWTGYKKRQSAILREQVLKLKGNVDNYGSIAITDITNDTTNLHPTSKWQVGDRLANLVLHDVYQQNINTTAPSITNVIFDKNKAIITVQSSGKLTVKGAKIIGFELAGEDKHFYPATAAIQKNKILVQAPQVTQPRYIRYSFTNAAVPNIFDDSQLPLDMYRNDDFAE